MKETGDLNKFILFYMDIECYKAVKRMNSKEKAFFNKLYEMYSISHGFYKGLKSQNTLSTMAVEEYRGTDGPHKSMYKLGRIYPNLRS